MKNAIEYKHEKEYILQRFAEVTKNCEYCNNLKYPNTKNHIMPEYKKLKIGDMSDNGQITIVDEDRLCYIVKSVSNGAVGNRTISKALLKEFTDYVAEHPDTNGNSAKEALSGKTEIDKYEYGYNATYLMLAKMILGYVGVIDGHTTSKHPKCKK